MAVLIPSIDNFLLTTVAAYARFLTIKDVDLYLSTEGLTLIFEPGILNKPLDPG
jgi:hypothetical protein